MFASKIGSLDFAWLLLDAGVDINHRAPDGMTVLVAATWKGAPEVVQFFVAAGAGR